MGRRGKRVRLAEGIYKDKSGISGVIKVGALPQMEKRFPPDTPIRTIKTWRDEMRVELRRIAPTQRRGTFSADVTDYLERVERNHIDTRAYKQRQREIEAWLPTFGHRLRATITAQEMNDQLWEWRKTKSAQTCNHRRTALGHLFVVLDGKSARNPVRDTVRFDPPDPKPKALPLDVIDRVLDALPHDSRTQARLRLMRWTGMRPSQIDRLDLDNFHLHDDPPHVVVPRGKKGRVVRLPFACDDALDVARTFVRVCFQEKAKNGRSDGDMSTESANKLLAAACKAVDVTPFTLYRIKHSVGSRLRQVMDIADIQKVYGHMNSSTTEIYAEPVDEKILRGFRHLEMAKPAPKQESA